MPGLVRFHGMLDTTMRSLSPEQRKTIGANIRARRVDRFPGHGGSRRCAEAFGVSPQLWSLWEGGKRTPPETRLRQVAIFFAVTPDDLLGNTIGKTDGSAPPAANAPPTTDRKRSRAAFAAGRLPGMPPPDAPESRCGLYRLVHRLIDAVMTDGIRIRLDERDIDRILARRNDRL